MACPEIGKSAAHAAHTCLNCRFLEGNEHFISSVCYPCIVTQTKCNFLPCADFNSKYRLATRGKQ